MSGEVEYNEAQITLLGLCPQVGVTASRWSHLGRMLCRRPPHCSWTALSTASSSKAH